MVCMNEHAAHTTLLQRPIWAILLYEHDNDTGSIELQLSVNYNGTGNNNLPLSVLLLCQKQS